MLKHVKEADRVERTDARVQFLDLACDEHRFGRALVGLPDQRFGGIDSGQPIAARVHRAHGRAGSAAHFEDRRRRLQTARAKRPQDPAVPRCVPEMVILHVPEPADDLRIQIEVFGAMAQV